MVLFRLDKYRVLVLVRWIHNGQKYHVPIVHTRTWTNLTHLYMVKLAINVLANKKQDVNSTSLDTSTCYSHK